MYNSIFVKVNDKEEKEASPENFDSYIEKLLEVYALSPNKPSIMFINYWKTNFLHILNKDKQNFDVTDFKWSETEKLQKFLDTPSVTFTTGNTISMVNSIFEKRSGIIPQNDIILIFDEVEKVENFPNLDVLTAISRSRRIYFILNFKDKDRFKELYPYATFDNIVDNCPVKFLYNSKGIFEIKPCCNTKITEY